MGLDKGIKVLSLGEQKRSISKGKKNSFQKGKKNVIRSTLESPFLLEWPELESETDDDLLQCLKNTFSGMKKIAFKPPQNELWRTPKDRRRAYMQEYSKTKLEEALIADPMLSERMRSIETMWADLVFGFNEVMRGIEKETVCAVLIKKDATPMTIVKSFLPICANKRIPLIPINGLDQYLKDEELLGLSHSCMVMGLKVTVKSNSSKYNALYSKMCESLDIDYEEESESDAEEIKELETTEGSLKSIEKKREYKYLRRDSKLKRIFVPGKSDSPVEVNINQTDASLDPSDEFISLGPAKAMKDITKTPVISQNTNNYKEVVSKSNNINLSSVAFESMFVLDEGGEEVIDNSRLPEVTANSGQNNQSDQDVKKNNQMVNKKRSKDNSRYFEYSPAHVKRIKGNPNRKKKSKEKKT